MTSQEFESLIKKDKYQVFIFTCPCTMPINFARHTWFVVNRKGIISRWELLLRLMRGEEMSTKIGYLYSNFYPKTEGLEMLPYIPWFHWKSKLFKVIEGDENSVAKKMADLIENSKDNYPYRDVYSLTGPNSNTYIEWVLNSFPELGIKLSWRAFGKNFKIK